MESTRNINATWKTLKTTRDLLAARRDRTTQRGCGWNPDVGTSLTNQTLFFYASDSTRLESSNALPPLRAFTGGVLDMSRRDARLQCRWGVTSARDPHPHLLLLLPASQHFTKPASPLLHLTAHLLSTDARNTEVHPIVKWQSWQKRSWDKTYSGA